MEKPETMRDRRVAVFGGTGFVGRYLVQRLAREGARLRVMTRDPIAGAFLKPMGDPGQVVLVAGDVRDPAAIRRTIDDADTVVNLVGILYPRGARTFAAIHVEGARAIAEAAREAGARWLTHLSALGADARSDSDYARSKAAGEAAVSEAFPGATILRPSVIFGPEDDFFNRFARLARISPVLPLIGGGRTRFQPVYVGDVADAICRTVMDPGAAGRLYELGGPAVYSFRELMEIVMRETGRRRLLLPLPFGLAAFQARFLEWLPKPPLTRDQVKLLARDNVVSGEAPGLADLGIQATAVEAIVPRYLKFYRPAGFGNLAPSV